MHYLLRGFVMDIFNVAVQLNEKPVYGQLQIVDRFTNDKITPLETLRVRWVEISVLTLPHSPGAYKVHTDQWDKKNECVQLQN